MLAEARVRGVEHLSARIDAADLSGLPPAYLCIGELDLMRDENIEYATRLMQAGVPTELHVYPGAFHGFEGLVPNAAVSVRAVNEYTRRSNVGSVAHQPKTRHDRCSVIPVIPMHKL